jgi:perosamine synthetase
MNIPLAKPDITDFEISAVVNVLRSGQLSLGPRVQEFEEKFARFVGARYAVAVSSGTTALHLAIRASGVGPEDEVITTPFSFVASTNCILYERALPVFIDIHPRTLNIDPCRIEDFLRSGCERTGQSLMDKKTGRTVKAILPVHVFGLPCDMDSIGTLAREYDLLVLEDACESLGGCYKGRHAGTFGHLGVFAFYPNKQMTTAEGGMIVTDNERLATLCRCLRNQGRDPGSEWLDHVRLGFNYRLSDVHCALGIAQLQRVPEILAQREQVAQAYYRALLGSPYLRLPFRSRNSSRGWFVFVVELVEGLSEGIRDRVLTALRQRGIGCQAYFPAIHQQPYLKEAHYYAPFALSHTESASSRCLALPFFSTLTTSEIRYAADSLADIFERELKSGEERSKLQAELPMAEAAPALRQEQTTR